MCIVLFVESFATLSRAYGELERLMYIYIWFNIML